MEFRHLLERFLCVQLFLVLTEQLVLAQTLHVLLVQVFHAHISHELLVLESVCVQIAHIFHDQLFLVPLVLLFLVELFLVLHIELFVVV